MSPAGWTALIAGVGLLLTAFVIYAGRLARYRCVLMPVHIIFTDTDLSFTFVLMNSGNRYVALTSLALAIEPFGTTSHAGASARLKSVYLQPVVLRPGEMQVVTLEYTYSPAAMYSSPPAGDADADGIKKVLWRMAVIVTDSEGCSTGTPLGGIEIWRQALSSSPPLRKSDSGSALYPIPLMDRRNWWPID